MKRILILLGIAASIVGFLMGRLTVSTMGSDNGYVPPLRIVGDIENCITYQNVDKGMQRYNIQYDNSRIKAMKLEDMVGKAVPVTQNYDLLLVGEDGLVSRIPGTNLEESYISFSPERGWEAINLRHPISSNIKRMKEIIVVSNENSWEYGLNIIEQDKNILNITPGQLYFQNMLMHPYFEGKSSKEQDGQIYETSIFTLRKVISIHDVVEDMQIDKILLMGKDGDYGYDDGTGFLEWKDHTIDYVYSDGKGRIKNVAGVLINPPTETVMDAYYDALHYLENDEKVMILYLDGFGYHQYEYAMDHGYLPYLGGLSKAKKVTTVYQPVTNAGFAAMITGKPPSENGVYSRKQKDLRSTSIFGKVKQQNKEGVLIEGDIGILNTEIPPILCSDRNGNGSTDDEIIEAALDNLQQGHDFIFVHFHGIDDYGHTYGDLAEETMDMIGTTDGYVENLITDWDGKVIITSDHGMHPNTDGGGHGSFRYEDLMIPYWVIQGEERQ
ncbi:MAG: alkaline phosphatase family protein [Bacillota bacterium]